MRRFVHGNRLAFWLVIIALFVALFVVLFLAGHGGVSGGSG